MLFHEVYGAYFSAVSEILRRAVSGELTPELMKQIETILQIDRKL